VWFAFANNFNGDFDVVTEHQQFDGDRNAVRGQAVLQAISGL